MTVYRLICRFVLFLHLIACLGLVVGADSYQSQQLKNNLVNDENHRHYRRSQQPSIESSTIVNSIDQNFTNLKPTTTTSSTSSDTHISKAQASKWAKMRDQIMESMLDGYRSYERPPGQDATNVIVFMKIVAMFSIDVRAMDYKMDILLRQAWNDSRLAWHHKPEFREFTDEIASPPLKEKLWLPDLFFRNGKEGYLHKLTLPNYLVRVNSMGEVLYSQKITMRFSCQMHLQTFPMDRQNCKINIGSYGYTLSKLNFVWKNDTPIELIDALEISEFERPDKFDPIDCSDTYSTATGQYTCLEARFELKRQLGSYLATTYIPNVLIIMVSWLSFWVNVDSAPARVPLGLLSLLGILTQAISASSTLPRVSYIKAIDIWMIFSIIFVIGVLVEYAIALTLLRRRKIESWHQDVKQIVHEELGRWCALCQMQRDSKGGGLHRDQLEFCEELETQLTKELIASSSASAPHYDPASSSAGKGRFGGLKGCAGGAGGSSKPRLPPGLVESEVDGYSRFLFPACYLLYNCFYWAYYLVIVDPTPVE